MLIIRQDQMQALSEYALRQTQNRLLSRIKTAFPRECREAGEASVREIVEKGMERAGKYGLENEDEVFRYISLMITLGNDFDQELPWAMEILNNDSYENKAVKMDILTKAAEEHSNEAETE